jgi:hypothetical protein
VKSQPGTLAAVAGAVSQVLAPLDDALAPDKVLELFESLGVKFPDNLLTAHPQLATALDATRAAARGLPAVLSDLSDAIRSGDDDETIAKAVELIGRIVVLVAAIAEIASELNAVDPAFAADFPGALLDYTVVRFGEDNAPTVTSLLVLAGLIDRTAVPAANASHPAYTARKLRLDRLGDFFRSPADYAQTLTAWGSNDLTPLFQRIADFLDHVIMPATLTLGPPNIDSRFFTMQQATSGSKTGLGFTVHVPVDSGIDLRFPLCPGNSLHLLTEAHFDGGVTGTAFPPADVALQATAELAGKLLVGYSNEPVAPDPARILLGQTNGSRIEVASVRADAGVNFVWDSSTSSASVEPIVQGSITGGKVVIDTSDGDGFISKLLSGIHVEGNFDSKLTWSPSSGLHFEGSATIEIAVPLHVSLGPIDLTSLYIVSGFKDDGIPIELSVAFDAALGPLQASVDRIGALAKVTFPPGGGNAGPANFEIGFKPPNGVGLAIDAGVVSGGGFLFIDTDRGEYDGILQLSIADIVTVTAIGLITTKNPDGSPGFSLLVIITAEFGAGIQLGFGFVLIGVGGLLGLNRTAKLEPLTEGVRTGAIDGIMFPHDVIANASRIISDLRNWFPPQNSVFLIGPMAKLGWGTPALITASFGIIVEIPPGDIIILGVLRAALPTEDDALVKLQVAFIGALEFDKKRLWFFAALFDSRIVFLTIEGEFGFLIAWGDDPSFVVSVGGFHPSFQPPPLPFPSPRRLAVSLIDTDWARVRVEGYLALTSNTAQFGAAAELFFGFDAFNISGHLAFDALFQFSPFHFIISISASFSLTAFGVGLLSVSISGSLLGPAPWEAKGTGSISLLFFSISADFDVTWGDSGGTTLPPIAVMPIFQGEIEKAPNWRALPPPTSNLLVSLRKLPDSDTLVLHPIGTLSVSQRAVPLDITLDKVGNQKPTDVNKLHIAPDGPGLVKKDDAREQFAPAQYQDMSDAEKLSRPGYVPETSGIQLTSARDTLTAKMVKRIVRYEQVILDTNKRVSSFFAKLAAGLFALFLRGNAASKSTLSAARQQKLQPFAEKIDIQPEGYSVAFQSTNKAFSAASASFSSETSAREFLSEQVAADPNLGDALHVIPSFEKAA